MTNQLEFKKFILDTLRKDKEREFEIKISPKKGLYFAEKIKECIEKNKSIFIYGDYDCDGCVSTAELYDIIKTLNIVNEKKAKIEYRLPSRHENYGLKHDFFEKAIESYDLFITIDNGTHSDFFEKLSEKDNEKLLVVDHHPNGDFEDRVNILNPNRDGRVAISSGILVDYIHQSIRRIDKGYAKKRPIDYYRDMTAITLISDVANINNKTVRNYIDSGLKRIEEREKPLYAHIFPKWKYEISVEDVAFDLIPKINALGRMGVDFEWIVDLLTQKVETEITKEQILALEDTNEQRKDAINYYTKILEEKMKRDGADLSKDRLLYAHMDEIPIGLNGLIAGNLASKYSTNAIFTSLNVMGDGRAVGSGRGDSIKEDFQQIVNGSKTLQDEVSFGGHLKAIGLKTSSVESLSKAVKKFNENNQKIHQNQGRYLVSNELKSFEDYREYCSAYAEICGNIPLSQSYFTTVPVLILGYSEYRNDFVKIVCADKEGSIMEFVTKHGSDIDIMSEDYVPLAIKIKQITLEDAPNVVMTEILTIDNLNNQDISDKIQIEKTELPYDEVKLKNIK